ncbi:ribonuclease J [Cryobacterium sp. CG_9.6]|nr:ribonuclease J [Cryobacterium sp. CG_9.6]
MTTFEIDGKILIVDCGVLFPDERQPGVDLILPDFGFLADRIDDVLAVVLTHGHEDHIGGMPYLLRLRSDIPIIGSVLTLAFLTARLREHHLVPNRVSVAAGASERWGPFGLEFIAVNHSVPDALAVAITTTGGTVLHTGDFNMDQLPIDGRITDLGEFARLGREGVDLLMIDSTNADIPGFSAHERSIRPALDHIIRRAPRRVIIAGFSSNVHRVQQVLDSAHSNGRRVTFLGRSMVRSMGIAAELGYLTVPPDVLVDFSRSDAIPENKMIYIATGSQGEPMAVLGRMVRQAHEIAVRPGDTVILASSRIPGNESAIAGIIDGLTKLGATVFHRGNALVHVSGHATAGPLLYVFNMVKPRNVLPVHGEFRHLTANAQLAIETGVSASSVILAENGTVIDLCAGRAVAVGQLDVGYVFVDGATVGELTEADLKDRRILAQEGFVSVIVVVAVTTGVVLVGPEVHARGFAEDESVFDALKPLISAALRTAALNDVRDLHVLSQIVRRVAGRWVQQTFHRQPMIVPLVIQA